MIVRRLEDGDALLDREALATWHQRSARTIRHYCTPVACDTKTRRTLYRHSEVRAMDKRTPKRRRRRLAEDPPLMAA